MLPNIVLFFCYTSTGTKHRYRYVPSLLNLLIIRQKSRKNHGHHSQTEIKGSSGYLGPQISDPPGSSQQNPAGAQAAKMALTL